MIAVKEDVLQIAVKKEGEESRPAAYTAFGHVHQMVEQVHLVPAAGSVVAVKAGVVGKEVDHYLIVAAAVVVQP